MENTITLDLPPHLASTAQAVARQTRRPLEEVLVDWLDQAANNLPLDSLSDEQVLSLARLEMELEQQEQLSYFLVLNREGVIAESERQQLDDLMAVYRRGLVRKAEALKAAVERGLTPLGTNTFKWSEDGIRILGLTPAGRATVEALHLSDDPDALLTRSYWVQAGWHPPAE